MINWEHGRRQPPEPAKVLLALLAKKPNLVAELYPQPQPRVHHRRCIRPHPACADRVKDRIGPTPHPSINGRVRGQVAFLWRKISGLVPDAVVQRVKSFSCQPLKAFPICHQVPPWKFAHSQVNPHSRITSRKECGGRGGTAAGV